jgi:hypothetical protein
VIVLVAVVVKVGLGDDVYVAVAVNSFGARAVAVAM